jgi:hypothetical protein
MGVNPAEIRTWDALDITRLLLVMNARYRARALWAKKNKVPFQSAPDFLYAPFYLTQENDDDGD